MCSFLVSSWLLANATHANFFLKPRGPDHTSHVSLHGFSFLHNLLHMTGDRVPQPFLAAGGELAAVYNGEIYNAWALAGPGDALRSDGDIILPAYERHGVLFPRLLDGEFAAVVIDFRQGKALLATDTFSTKPLWYSTHSGLHFSSYRSGLVRLGVPDEEVHMADPNMIAVFVFGSSEAQLVERHVVFEFDLRQFKEDTVDFQAAFERAVRKRVKHTIHPLFIGLSSGYDSGAIHAALVEAGVGHFAYTVYSTEDLETLARRIEWAGPLVETNVIVLSGGDLEREAAHLAAHCEPFQYRAARGQNYSVAEDPASFGLSYIFREVRRRGILVYVSGTGADEIISDYGHGGRRIFPHSSFGGLFPEDLRGLFPWEGFFLGTQRDYLMKEELVAGAHGVESRYPFLDRAVVQEFLWLASGAKNAKYKAPIHDWLARLDYPFRPGEKLGFNAGHNVRWGEGQSLVARHHERRAPGDAGAEGPQPLAGGARLEAREEELRSRERDVAEARRELAEQRVQLRAEAEELSAARGQLAQLQALLESQWRQLREQAALIQEQQGAQAESALRFMALRLVPIQQAAVAPSSFLKEPLAATEAGDEAPSLSTFDTGHPRWSGVEVLTCVSGGRFLSVMDFPVYHIFRASTPLPVHNVCENVEWEGMHMRLRLYARFLAARAGVQGRQRLYLVSDGADVLFNGLEELLAADAELRGRPPREAAALLVIRRYEALGAGRAVFATERLCGWGGAHLCSREDEARYPAAPTDSKYLNAGGYLGPAALLEAIIREVLRTAESAKRDAALGDLRAKTTATDAAGGETDQYFFKLYFWQHPEVVALDYHQSIFGNFLEVESSPCYDGWQPRCAVQPCCTLSDSFKRFRETFYGNYQVKACSIWRRGHLPISWHGNGAGKWLWLISLEELSRQCAYVANLTVQRYPVEPIERLFESFDKARVQRSAQG